MEKVANQPSGAASKPLVVGQITVQQIVVQQIKARLDAGDYSAAIDLLRAKAADFPDDPDLANLEKLAKDGLSHKAEADRLITESQELFAQQKSAEALQLLRKAYELDKRNGLARAILANSLVEHAQSLVETDWLQAETLTNQALALNPAHPTAKTIRNAIQERKSKSSADEWVEQATKLQSAGDLFAALAWVAEGLAVHPDHPKLVQVQDAIQRDQAARKRQARRGDVEELRRMEREIAGASDDAAKQALAERVQAMAAKYWTDGEILAIANALLIRLGLSPKGSSSGSTRKGLPVIFHVPRATAPKVPAVDAAPVVAEPIAPSKIQPTQAAVVSVAADTAAGASAGSAVAAKLAPKATPTIAAAPPVETPAAAPVKIEVEQPVKVAVAPAPAPAKAKVAPPRVAASPAEPSVSPAEVAPARVRREAATRSKFMLPGVIAVAVVLVIAAGVFVVQRNHPKAVAHPASEISAAPAPVAATAVASEPPASSATAAVPTAAPAIASTPAEVTPPASPAPTPRQADVVATKPATDVQPPVASVRNVGTLVVMAGQDDVKVSVNGKPQPQLTRGGQLRLPNLEVKDYVVQVSKNGYVDPPQQKISLRKGVESKLVFNLQPVPRVASLSIQGGTPGATVLVDQASVGTVQADGTLSVATIAPGDHTVELRKDSLKPHQFKKHFVEGGTITLAATDAVLEAAPGQLKITFTPANASVALVKGDQLKMVSSGSALNLAPGTYTLTARTAERFTRSATLEVIGGQSKNLELSLGPSGMSKFENAAAWTQEKDAFVRKGGEFSLYGVAPTSGTFTFSAMPTKGHLLQWVMNYTDAKNYVLFQIDENNFYRTVIRNGEKREQAIFPDKGDKKGVRTVQIRVSPAEIVHQIKLGDTWNVVDRWSQPGVNLGAGKFGFYVPGSDQIAVTSFAHYAELNVH